MGIDVTVTEISTTVEPGANHGYRIDNQHVAAICPGS